MQELIETFDSKLQYCPTKQQNVVFTKDPQNQKNYICEYAANCPASQKNCYGSEDNR